MPDWVDSTRVIRFEGPTAASPRFVGPPVLRWRPVRLATRFEVAVADQGRVVWTGTSAEPRIDLAPAWPLLQQCRVDVLVRGFDDAGDEVSVRAYRQFWKVPGFDGVRPEPADWSGALHRTVGFLLGAARDEVRPYEGDVPRSVWSAFEDTVTGLRAELGFPALHHPSFVLALLGYAERFPGHPQAAEARGQALAYGQWLLANHLPDDWRCGGLTPSTVQNGEFGGWIEGENITLFRAARVGEAMVRLARDTGDQRFLRRAARIADVLTDLQEPDGSWPCRVEPRTGTSLGEYTSAAITPLRLLKMLLTGTETGAGTPRSAWAAAAAKAEAWLLAGPVADGRWEGMYEDVAGVEPWQNLENWDTNETIRYLLSDECTAPDRSGLAAGLNAFIEDQFVVWGPEVSTVPVHCPTPTVIEQYKCYWPMECHTGNWLVSLIALHQATGEEHYLTKAIAAANSIVATQDPNGSLSTWGVDTRFGTRVITTDWPGCNAVAVSALLHWTAYADALETGQPYELGPHGI